MSTTTKSTHTLTPWRFDDEGGDQVFVMPSNPVAPAICVMVGRVYDKSAHCSQITPEDIANARLIVTAVNHHAELMTSLRNLAHAAGWDYTIARNEALDLLVRLDAEAKA